MNVTKIEELRREKGLTMVEVSTAIGIGRTTYGNIEKGTTVAPVTTAIKLARFFETTVEELFKVED